MNLKMNVFVTRVLPQKGLNKLEDAGCTVKQHSEKRELSQQELIELCQDQDFLLSTGPIKIDAHFLQKCSHLKGIALMSVGYDNVDIPAATKYNISVYCCPVKEKRLAQAPTS